MTHTRIAIASLLILVAACDDSPPEGQPTTSVSANSSGNTATSTGSGMGGNGTGGAPDCYENPTTHEEIINACTDAEKIDKNPVLPLQNPDGSLPPIP
jgi:hypothetical protein